MTPSFTSPPDPKLYQTLVWEITRQVSPGMVTTYGQIASMIPPPGALTPKDYAAFGARWVGGRERQLRKVRGSGRRALRTRLPDNHYLGGWC